MNQQQNTDPKQDLKTGATPTDPVETNPQDQQDGERVAGTLMKILAIVGLIAVLALAAWLSIQAIRYSPTAFSTVSSTLSSAAVTLNSVFSVGGDSDELALSVENSVLNSGEPTTFAFEHDGENAQYVFSFACTENLRFRVQEENGEYTTVTCDEPYEFSGRSELRLIPESEDARFLDTTVTLAVSGSDISDTTDVTIVNETVPEEEGDEVAAGDDTEEEEDASDGEEPSETPATPVTPVRPVTPADLAIVSAETGIGLMDDGECTFYEAGAIPSDQTGAIRFSVENIGGTAFTDSWDFAAKLPIEGNDYDGYESPTQRDDLNPGDGITFTLCFDALEDDDDEKVIIMLRTDGEDSNANNNSISRILNIREAE